MFRDGDLRRSQDGLEMADAERALSQDLENPEPRFVTETLVNFDELHQRCYIPIQEYESQARGWTRLGQN
jgi:hypothetical protein